MEESSNRTIRAGEVTPPRVFREEQDKDMYESDTTMNERDMSRTRHEHTHTGTAVIKCAIREGIKHMPIKQTKTSNQAAHSRAHKTSPPLPPTSDPRFYIMNLSLALFALYSASHSVHAKETTSLRGRAGERALASVVAGGADEVQNRGVRELQDQADSRIIGGSEPIEDRFAYAVNLDGCGGSLIARDVVLTAAHCGVGRISAVLGRHDVNDGDGEVLSIRGEVPHPEYSDELVDNDFMLVFLEGTPTANNIITVKLNSDPSFPNAGQDMTVMGWGDTDPRDGLDFQTPSNVLMNVDVAYISNEECEAADGVVGSYSGLISESEMCARTAGRDSCKGDSGGPLIVRGDDGATDVQVGVVSWGFGCALDPYPGVYARVSHAYEWIQREVCMGSVYASEAGFDCSSNPTNPPVSLPTNPPVSSPTNPPDSSPTNPPVSLPTNPPFSLPTYFPTYSLCTDSAYWVDSDGDGCEWYEANDLPGCPIFGIVYGTDAGTAKDNCCFCMTI